MEEELNGGIGRRSFLTAAGALAVAPLLSSGCATSLASSTSATGSTATASLGRRRLGRLEVSSVGLGVQNNTRRYDTTTPYRPEQIRLIRDAYDHGVRFFDTAEAYGPFECEKILGELQSMGLYAGANALIVGNYLTTLGRLPEEDIALLESLGMPVAGGGPGEGRFIVAADGNKSLPAKPARKHIPVDTAP